MEPALLDVKAHLAGQSAKGWRKVDDTPPHPPHPPGLASGWKSRGMAGQTSHLTKLVHGW